MRVRVSKSDYSDDRALLGHCERLPVEVAGPHVRLGQDDQGDRLMSSDEPDLVRGYVHGDGGPPVALIDRCQAEGRRIFHGVILAHRFVWEPLNQPGSGQCWIGSVTISDQRRDSCGWQSWHHRSVLAAVAVSDSERTQRSPA